MYINTQTKLCAVIGNPIEHTLSPVIHNAAIVHYKINAVFLAFQIEDVKGALDAMRILKIRAFSVTIPFKEAVMPYLDEVDSQAAELRNVNTIINDDGRLKGYNTDIDGVELSLKGVGIKNKKVLLIGAGGVSKTIAYVVNKKGGKLHIINRDVGRARKLAGNYNASYYSLDNINEVFKLEPKVIINSTPIGMGKFRNKSLVPSRFLKRGMVVFDVIYNPKKTKFIKEAEVQGCTTITGDIMFLGQGAKQFELWSGKKAPFHVMEKALLKTHFLLDNNLTI